MINLDRVLKSRDITLLTKVCIVKAMVFPVVVYGCEKGKVKVAQSCLTLCNPRDYTVHGILQARILEEVAFFFSPGDLPNPETQVSGIEGRFFTSRTTREAQQYWSG